MKAPASALAVFLMLLTLLAGSAFALRCGQGLVTVGDSKLEVLEKCGEPFWTDRHALEFRERIDSERETRSFINVDEWTYNLGPHKLLHYLRFENGRLVDIDTGPYGFDPERRGGRDTCRGGKLLDVGDTTAEVLIKCGAPNFTEQWLDESIERSGPGHKWKTLDTIEDWSYNFGPHDLIHILRFRNGRVVRIEKGGYGY